MATSPPAQPPSRRPRLRFSVAGLFLCLLGVAVGLAYWRVSRSIPYALLASFSAWFVIGMIQQTKLRVYRIHQSRGLPADHRSGLLLQIVVSIGLALMLVATLAREIAQHPSSLNLHQQYSDAWLATRMLIDSAFLFVVICAYWLPHNQLAQSRSKALRYWRFLCDAVAVVTGFGFLGALLVVSMELVGLVWLAIHGTEVYLPARWGGEAFCTTPAFSKTFVNHFVAGGMFAAALLTIGTAATAALHRYWSIRSFVPTAYALLSAVCLAGTLWLLLWCNGTALPRLSPAMASTVGNQLPANYMLAGIFLVAGCSALAVQLAALRSSASPLDVDELQSPTPYVHHRHAVVVTCLLGVVASLAINTWNYSQFVAGTMPAFPPFDLPGWWRLLNYFGECLQIQDPANLLRLATILVLLRWLWRSFRGTLPRDEQWSVNPRQFAGAWLGSFAILALAGPVFAWWGFALTLKFYFQF